MKKNSLFKKGDKVSVLDDDITGIVDKVSETVVSVFTDDDFILEFAPHELIKLDSQKLTVNRQEVLNSLADKETQSRRQPTKSKRKEKEIPPMEVDLHIHQLVPNSKGMTNHDMLSLQLETARRQLEFAIKKRIQKVVFIHGVGEGILRTELEYIFGRYENITFYDANYQKYGVGATEVYIYQNSK